MDAVLISEERPEVEARWGICQRIVAVYREPEKEGEELMWAAIHSITVGVQAALVEV